MKSLKRFLEIFNVKHEEVMSKGVQLQVVENKKMRMFKLDSVSNSRINKHSVFTGGFWDYLLPITYVYNNPRILMIGLGIGTVPYQLRMLGKKFSMDIVEFDPEVIKLAKKYAIRKIKERIILDDGAVYVAQTKKKYDVIILDAYWKGANIPEQFFGKEFIRNASGILSKDGVLEINYAMHPSGMIKFIDYKKLLSKFFKIYDVKTKALGDTDIIICSKLLGKDTILEKVRKGMKRNRANNDVLDSYEKMKEL